MLGLKLIHYSKKGRPLVYTGILLIKNERQNVSTENHVKSPSRKIWDQCFASALEIDRCPSNNAGELL